MSNSHTHCNVAFDPILIQILSLTTTMILFPDEILNCYILLLYNINNLCKRSNNTKPLYRNLLVQIRIVMQSHWFKYIFCLSTSSPSLIIASIFFVLLILSIGFAARTSAISDLNSGLSKACLKLYHVAALSLDKQINNLMALTSPNFLS